MSADSDRTSSDRRTTTMRQITIETTWTARHTFEVADDYEAPNESGFEFGQDIDGNDIAESIDTLGAEMVDWGIVQ